MTEQQLLQAAVDYVTNNPGNAIPAEKALRPEIAGVKIFDAPIMGVASAMNQFLLGLPGNPDMNAPLSPPQFWLESAASIISLFFPLTAQVRESNRNAGWDVPSQEMIHARNEGAAFANQTMEHLKGMLEAAGYEAVIPVTDPRFWMAFEKPVNGYTFTSNWSERHVAFAAGLGTFSFHRGIITRLGTAGRLSSIITSLELPPTHRPYTDLYEYCAQCGVCIETCPAGAITVEKGKDHAACREFLRGIAENYKEKKYFPSCGKCQMAVPCESELPLDFLINF